MSHSKYSKLPNRPKSLAETPDTLSLVEKKRVKGSTGMFPFFTSFYAFGSIQCTSTSSLNFKLNTLFWPRKHSYSIHNSGATT